VPDGAARALDKEFSLVNASLPARRFGAQSMPHQLRVDIMSRIAIKNEHQLGAPTRQAIASLDIDSRGIGFTDISPAVGAWIEKQGFDDGLLALLIMHTSASLSIQDNAPWRHTSEGPDDMPAHLKSALTDTSLVLPVRRGKLVLGTWQTVYLVEHRQHGQARSVQMHYMGS
jgi:thiamine phosphate synthase YjbQ (UPF0047 family)